MFGPLANTAGYISVISLRLVYQTVSLEVECIDELLIHRPQSLDSLCTFDVLVDFVVVLLFIRGTLLAVGAG